MEIDNPHLNKLNRGFNEKIFKSEKIKNSTKLKTIIAQGSDFESFNGLYKIKNISSNSQELTEELLKEITMFYRYIFNNAFPEYSICIDCDEQFSAPDAFGTNGDYVSLEKIDSPLNLPNCFLCNDEMKFFIDEESTIENLRQKFQKDFYITFFRDKETDKLLGLAFGYFDSMRNLVDKEWGHPHNYMKKEYQQLARKLDIDKFILNASITVSEEGIDEGVDENERVFAWNCAAIDDSISNKGCLSFLMKNFFQSLPQEDLLDPHLKTVFHVLNNSKMHDIVKYCGCKTIKNIPDNRYSYVVGQLSEVAANFSKSREDFSTFISALKNYTELGYVSNKFDNSKLELEQNGDVGRSVWAKENIEEGEIVASFRGHKYSAKKLSDIPNVLPVLARDHVVQIGEELYIHAKKGLAECINHSCSPNCGIKDIQNIVAMRSIKQGEQITWDYEMTEDSDWVMENCQCGSEECRDTIRGYSFMPQEIRDKYKGFISEWILKKYKS